MPLESRAVARLHRIYYRNLRQGDAQCELGLR